MQCNVDLIKIRILVSRSDGDKSYTQAMSTKGRPQSPLFWTHFEKVGGMFPKDTPSWLQKLLSFRYQKPNQIPIEGTVSNPEFEPNQISATRNQSRMRTGQASILVKVIKMSKYWRKTSKNKGSGVNLGCPCQRQYDYLFVRAI